MPRPLLAALLAGTVLAATACGAGSAPGAAGTPAATPPTIAPGTPSAPGSPAPASGSPAASGPCRSAAPPARYASVVWIWLENRGSSALSGMPYLSRLAASCGLATDYHAVTHPSLPNYLAAVSGSTGGVHSDCGPDQCPQRRTTLFAQVSAAGGTWRSYEEAMPHPCAHGSGGRYAAKHNPAVYFPALAADCARWDVPLDPALGRDVAAGSLPWFSFVTPDLCNDGHDCSTPTVDRWLSGWLPRLVAGPDYRSGRTAIFITWDEAEGGGSNRVATVVVAPSVRPGTRAGERFTHYSLLRTTEELLGLPPLAAAAAAASMRAAFHL